MRKYLLIITTIFTLQISNAQTDSLDYFGQTPPGETAVIFAKDIISISNRWEAEIVFTADGKECYFEVEDDETGSKIFYTKLENNTWTEQVEAPFSKNHRTGSPFLSADGKRLYFNYWNDDFSSSEIYFVERTTGEWGESQHLPSPFNSSSVNFGYAETIDSVVYICSTRPGGYDSVHGDIWCIRRSTDQTLQAKNLGLPFNSTGQDANPCVAPDGSYIIFNTNGHSNCWNDLFISFKNGNNEWTTPIDMNSSGAKINIHSEVQRAPTISPDGKFLFFSRVKAFPTSSDPMDIYWVSTSVIAGLKKNVFAPKLSKQIPGINISSDSTLNFVIPSSTFSCEYGVETLQYSAALNDGSALPSWLSFNSQTRTLSGKPAQAETINIKITAVNADTVSASCTFKITVTKVTGVEDEDEKLPTEFKLNQNYPNPFNPSTNISYLLTVAGNVKLIIYNILGQKVKTLMDSYKNSGEHSVVWDGMDEKNTPVNSGIYFYKLEANGMSFQKKMILIR